MQFWNSIPCKFVKKKDFVNDLNTEETNSGRMWKELPSAAPRSSEGWSSVFELLVKLLGQRQEGERVSVWGGTSAGFVYRWGQKLWHLTRFYFFIYFLRGPARLEVCSAVLGEFSAEANKRSVSREWISSPGRRGVLSTTGTSPGDLGSPWVLWAWGSGDGQKSDRAGQTQGAPFVV